MGKLKKSSKVNDRLTGSVRLRNKYRISFIRTDSSLLRRTLAKSQIFNEYRILITETTGHGALMITGDTRLSLSGQMTLLNEWVANAQNDTIASRESMRPAQFISELAYISVLEKVDSDVIFRISGSEIRKMLGREARGHRLVQFPVLAKSEAGTAAVRSAFKAAQPVSGANQLPRGLTHFWLRLPLVDARGEITQLLCHDRILNQEMMKTEAADHPFTRKVKCDA